MATAKSLIPAELQTVLAYTATQLNAQRNRAMLMMTVAAGLRVGEVAGLTLGDVLDSTGAVRGEVFLAAHRVKHQHARTIYINSRLQQELAALQGADLLLIENGAPLQLANVIAKLGREGGKEVG